MVDICALCGRETEMTFEHIPPKSCFNSTPFKPVSGETMIKAMSDNKRNPWETNGLPYENQQRGFGKWSLCSDCYSKTGSWYGEDYAKFSRSLHSLLEKNDVETNGYIDFEIFDVYPLRIVKQMLSMICSINQQFFDDERIKTIADFVLDNEAKVLNNQNYRIFFYLISNKTFTKVCPMSWLIKGTNNTEEFTIDIASEIYAYPIGIVVYFNPREGFNHCGVDITELCEAGYDQKANMRINVPILESNILFPCDYRSREEITSCMNSNIIDEMQD